ncbi:ATP-dependent RNA helicase RhlE [Rubripirellula amarantea]|uniref:DEAD-box ATP-dependent RNA helicase RhpA n=1 Tax=Rubripirellula amarantea TaxID=2527999 RepID=A0A5C5WYB2_9BACT|nr:DEAD/DEAH box helicase [Rubripirellula amarantea]TWT54993.1 ATP-dependent RNA helicase RhlE [Rubripirellula amarantea]
MTNRLRDDPFALPHIQESLDTPLKTFSELKLIAPLERALKDQNYEIPTPIQAQTIPHALEGKDILGCAQTGTGKTAAFALPLLDFLGGEKRIAQPGRPQALVLAPTRELAIQIGDSMRVYGKHLKLRTVLVFGGVNQNSQVREMQRGAHILVATPGRLLDLMEQGHINLGELEVFILDEADRMLDMGFLPDLKRIIAKLPDDRQSMFFSATMPPKIVDLANQLLFNPISVNVTPKETSVKRITQELVFCDRGEKPELLRQIVVGQNVDRVIVFTRTKRGANVVAKKLEQSGTEAAIIHGNKSQAARQKALAAFRDKKVRVLVATDVAARGIDIDNVTHVVNYDLPNEPEAYVHRIGRTGRAGAEGIAISFCSGEELDDLKEIEKLLGMKIPRDPNSVMPAWEPKRKPGGGGQRRGGGGSSRRSGQAKASSGGRKPASRGPGAGGQRRSKPKNRRHVAS